MKKLFTKVVAILACVLMVASTFSVVGCKKTPDLRVYNCYDYIDEQLIDDFEEYYEQKTGKKISVEYSCFDTPEDLYSQLKINSGAYDLVCPSDYMIEKMAREDMLKQISLPQDSNYIQNLSPYIKNVFENITWGANNEFNLSQYAVGYMWGTLGLVYNADKVADDDMKSWSTLWTTDKKFSIKDSVRDTYFVGLAKYYATQLEGKKADYLNQTITADEYSTFLKEKFNDTSATTVSAVESLLKTLKAKSNGMEVDSGKDEIIKGDIDVYFAWSGDAVYAIDEASSSNVNLKYSVPEEGSNVWFDGWCVPKGAKNVDLALEFADFLSRPDNVQKNMEYIGYVSCVAGNEVFNWVQENYGSSEGQTVDLNYFFKGANDQNNYQITVDAQTYNVLTAQYPTKNIIDRCVVMNYYNDTANERIMDMWTAVKAN